MRPADAPPPRGDGTVSLFRAGGRDAEIEEVFRRIFAAGVPFDHVEIACVTGDDAVLVWEKAQRHDWPATIEPGVPVALTRPGRALLAFCAWIESGFTAAHLRRLFHSGDVRLDVAGGPTPGQAARLLARSGATWGRATYAAVLARLLERHRAGAADPEADDATTGYHRQRAGQVERLSERVAALLSLVPEADEGELVPIDRLVLGCRAFTKAFAAVASELDGAAAVVLDEALADLEALGALRRPVGDGLRMVRDRVATLGVGGDRARPGHLHVTLLPRAGYAGRPHVFALGLEEGRVLPPLLEDPVLLDDERRALGPSLATSSDRVGEALHQVVSRLAVLGGHVTFGFTCRDLRESRETFPSWLVLQAFRLEQRGGALAYDELNRTLGEPVSAVPARPGVA